MALFVNTVAFECRRAASSALSFPRRRQAFAWPSSRFTLIHAANGGLYIKVSWDTLLAAYHRGYTSAARLDETALRPSRYVTIFTNRTTKGQFRQDSYGRSDIRRTCLIRILEYTVKDAIKTLCYHRRGDVYVTSNIQPGEM